METGVGYYSNCRKFDRLVKLIDVEASPPGIGSPQVQGLFLEDEVTFRHEDRLLGINIANKAFEGCEFENADEEGVSLLLPSSFEISFPASLNIDPHANMLVLSKVSSSLTSTQILTHNQSFKLVVVVRHYTKNPNNNSTH